MVAPEVISSRITSYSNVKGQATIRANGRDFMAAKDCVVFNNQTGADGVNRTHVNGTTYTIYADNKGDIIGINAVTASKNFVYVSDFGYRFTTPEDALRERLSLRVELYDAEGNKSYEYVDTTTDDARGGIETTLIGLTHAELKDGWSRAAMIQGEDTFVKNLQATSKGIYFMSRSSSGVILVDLETYAANQKAAEPYYVYALAENGDGEADDETSTELRPVYRGVAGLRNIDATKLVDGENTNFNNGAAQVSLYANAETVFFYVNGNKVTDVKVGISRATNASKSKDGVYTEGSKAWYAEYEYDYDAKTVKNDAAYAQVVVVSIGEDEGKKATNDTVYIYLDDGLGTMPGSYTKIDNGDNTWTVEYNVIRAGETERTVKSVLYSSQEKANAGIEHAAGLVNNWVVVNDSKDGGVIDWFLDDDGVLVEGNERKSDGDKLTYVKRTDVQEIRSTNDGVTIFYDAQFKDSANSAVSSHYRGVELTDDDLINDVRKNISGNRKINSSEELTPDLRVLIAYDSTLVAKAIYVVD